MKKSRVSPSPEPNRAISTLPGGSRGVAWSAKRSSSGSESLIERSAAVLASMVDGATMERRAESELSLVGALT